jgi:CRISPR-associated protein Cmr1
MSQASTAGIQMRELHYQLSFNSPAFLGNALQEAQWRTPPIKALIRQWWRVVQKARTFADTERMRHDEGLQFGNSWLSDGDKALHRKSDLLIRLSDFSAGGLTNATWQNLDIDNVKTGPKTELRADLYTGYGSINSQKAANGRRPIVIPRGAIDAGKEVLLRLGMKSPIPDLEETLKLVHWFGTMGSRSRNGWGSVRMEPANDDARTLGLGDAMSLATRYARPWRDCLKLDWPHAIGCDDDGRPLVWVSDELEHWRAAIGRLARIRVAVRLAAKRIRDPSSSAGAIHYLGYPAGTGKSNPWNLPPRNRNDQEPRLASPLRFKILRSGTKVRTLVVHMPARLPEKAFLQVVGRAESSWLGDDRNWFHAWQEIHRMLDQDKDPMLSGKSLGLRRLGTGEWR